MSGSIYKKIIQDTGYIGLANVLSSLSSLLFLPILTKALGANDYGIFVQVSVTISLVMSFGILGLPYTMVRFLAASKDKEQISDDISSSIILITITSIIISILIFIFAELIGQSFFGSYIDIVRIVSLIVPLECLNWTLLNVFRIFQEVKKYSLITLFKTYTELIVIFLIRENGIFWIVFSLLIIRFIFLIILFLIIRTEIVFVIPRFKGTREHLRFSLPTIPGTMAAWMTNMSDRYFISFFLGSVFVGYYTPGYILGGLISTILLPINFVLINVLAKYYEEGKLDIVRNIFHFSLKYSLILAIPATFGISLLSKPILAIMSTSDIAEHGYLITPFSAFSMLIFGIGGILNYSLYLTKRTDIFMINLVIVGLVNLCLNYLLITRIGIIGAAISTLMAYLVGFIFGTYFSFKYFDFYFDYRGIIKIIVSSSIMAVIVAELNPKTLNDILLAVPIGLIVYITLIICFRVISFEEIKFLEKELILKSSKPINDDDQSNSAL